MNKLFTCTSIWLIMFSIPTSAQDSITLRDATQMRYRAVNIIKSDLNDLLNAIVNSDNTTSDYKIFITNSYTKGNRNQIFPDSKVIIENDINPSIVSSNEEHNTDVNKYLGDLDIFYNKSPEQSIIFSNIRASNPKKGADNYIYLNVYYNSIFRNAHNKIEKPYALNNRKAEIQMEKKDKTWIPFIKSITFFSPEDTLNDFLNDLPLYNENAVASNGGPSVEGSDTISFEQIKKLSDEQEMKKLIDEENAFNEKFKELLDKGDVALDDKDFTTALRYYKEANELKPLDKIPRGRLLKVLAEQNRAVKSKESLYEFSITNAVNEERKRNYQEASRQYKNAVKAMPEKANLHESKIKEMDNKWESVSELEIKYAASTSEAEFKELIEDYEKAIKKNKNNSDLYVGKGKCYEKLNNLTKALKDYDLAYNMDKKNLQALLLRAELKKRRNGKDDNFSAMSDYKKILNENDQDLPVYVLMADLRLVIKPDDFDGALNDLEAGLKIESKYAPFYYKTGLIFAQKKDYKEAIKHFTNALGYDNNYALAYFHRGKNLLSVNSISLAAKDFEDARKSGLDVQNINNIGIYAQSFANRAAEKFTAGKLDSAITLIDYAISINPINSEYSYTRGNYFLSKRDNHEAIKSLDKAVDQNSNFTEAYYKLGLAYYNLANYNTAAKNFQRTLELDIKHFDAQKALGDSYFALKDYNKAAQNYETFLKTVTAGKTTLSTPLTVAEVYNSMGKSYFLINESDERALEAFKDAIKKNPAYADAFFNRGLYYHKKVALPDAIKDLEKALSLDAKHPAGWNYQLAQAYQDKGDFLNAANNYKATLAIDSSKNYQKAVYLLAYNNYQLPDYTNALQNYQKVRTLGLDSGINSFNYELGTIFLNLNKPDSAFECLNKAYLKDSTSGNVLYALATTHQLKGKTDDALKWFERAFQLKQIGKKQVTSDKLIASLRDDKRFKALMKKYF